MKNTIDNDFMQYSQINHNIIDCKLNARKYKSTSFQENDQTDRIREVLR